MPREGGARSRLDRPAARAAAIAVAASALALAGWLVYLENRTDPRIAACVARQTATIRAARDKGTLPAVVAERFLARVAQSCAAAAR